MIGGGGTGSEVAFGLAEHGMRVAIAERDKLGGECNHYGCVPTKVMLRSAKAKGTMAIVDPKSNKIVAQVRTFDKFDAIHLAAARVARQ